MNDHQVSLLRESPRSVVLDRENGTALLLENEPTRVTIADFRDVITAAILAGATDITLQSDQQPRIEIHGSLFRGTRRPWSPTDIDMVLMEVYGGANARAEINGRKVLDFSYEITMPGGAKQRFRVNATGIFGRDGGAVEITMRVLPVKTPDLELVRITDEEIKALTPRDGIVVIAGATGSGKSTTMAAVTRYHLEASGRPVKIVDLQAPIEYTFRDVTERLVGSASVIGQSEIGRHITSFAEGVRSALRRKPHIINVGESRDFETISASLEASLTGHLVYTTTHAGSAAEAIQRLLTAFPGNEREARAFDLISSLRFLMVQHLVPRIDKPGRVPIREYLRLTDRVRERMIRRPISEWPAMVSEEISGDIEGRTSDDLRMCLKQQAAKFYREGVISLIDAELLARQKNDITRQLAEV